MTDPTPPSRRAGLRDEIAAALEAADYRMDMRRGDLADAVLPVLYRAWPWLRAEAEDAAAPPVDRAAVLRDAAEICDEAAAVYAEKGADDPASGANTAAGALFALMERFLRKADEAEYVATPCDPMNPCEDGGEPCHVHERLMAHAEGEHELCEPDCGGHWPRRLAGETPATTEARCPSCDHEAKYHAADDGRCWFTVDHGLPGSNLVCPCAPRKLDADETAAAEARQDGAQTRG